MTQVVRPWDTENKYTEAFLKAYAHWVLEVNYRQPTLGCYVIFARRSVERISELTNEEMHELKDVMAEMEMALARSTHFQPDRFNYCQLGNNLHHLHFHGIPRYATPRQFGGKQWMDTTWGTAPVWIHKDSAVAHVVAVREALKPYLFLPA